MKPIAGVGLQLESCAEICAAKSAMQETGKFVGGSDHPVIKQLGEIVYAAETYMPYAPNWWEQKVDVSGETARLVLFCLHAASIASRDRILKAYCRSMLDEFNKQKQI